MMFLPATPAQPRRKLRRLACTTPDVMLDLSDFVTVQDAAQELGFNVISLRVLLRREKIRGKKVGKIWLVSKSSVNEYKAKTAGLNKHDPRRGKTD